MIKQTWLSVVAAGLIVGTPSLALAHGQYLEEIDGAAAEIAALPCTLEGMTCGLCHEPSAGDRLENIAVGFSDIETGVRNGPFFESLTGAGAGEWMPIPHMSDNNAHRDTNQETIVNALAMMLANQVDSDADGVTDMDELSIGYNPLLAYDEADPEISKICDAAGDFPDVDGGGSSGSGSSDGGDSTGGDMGTTGNPDPTTGGSSPGDSSGGDPTNATNDTNDTNATNATNGTDPTTPGSGGSGDSGGSDSTAGGDDQSGGCRIHAGGSGERAGLLGLLLVMGLGARRRRRG